MPDRIQGSWLDFHHPNPWEADYWNYATADFTEDDWDAKLGEMSELGIEDIIVLSVALHGKSFYPSRHFPMRWNLTCLDPIAAVLSAAERHQQRVHLGLGFFRTPVIHDFDHLDELVSFSLTVAGELEDRYGHYPAFSGWYFPVEAGIDGVFPPRYVEYVNALAAGCRTLTASRTTLIAPFGTSSIDFGPAFQSQVADLQVDFVAYQDEAGVKRLPPEEIALTFRRLREVHAHASAALWADIEVFDFDNRRLGPAPIDRVVAQIQGVGPSVERLLCYQYLGMMNKSEEPAFAGHPKSLAFRQDYLDYLARLPA